jgi:hypothetical protein
LTHRFGELVDVDLQAMTPMPPIQTVLDWGRGRRRESIPVVLETELTEIGTLAMRVVTQSDFAAREGEAQWNLEFDVRGSAPQQDGGPLTDGIGEIGEIVDESQIARCTQALDTVFGEQPSGSPSQAYGLISDAIGLSRKQWPVSLLRSLWGYLLEHADCRKRSPDAEARWLNLVGWCLRPGFGYPADDWRVQQTWRSVHNKLMHRSSSGVSESIILWRRISGGFTAGQQNALYQDCWSRVKPMLIGGGTQASTNVLAELLRLLGSLERLRSADKSAVAEACLQALEKKKMEPLRPALLWTIGRLGCRVPVYASLQQTVSIERAMAWIDALLAIDAPWVGKESSAYCLALMLLARKTGDRYRDVSEKVRGRVVERMNGLGAPAMHLDLVERGGRLDDEQTAQVVGDSLPLGFALRT